MSRGIRTLRQLRLRCVVHSDCGCWEWTGATKKGSPVFWAFDPVSSVSRTMQGLRAAYILKHGKVPPPKHLVWAPVSCMPTCLNPDHHMNGTKADFGAYTRVTGSQRGNPVRSAINRASARRSTSSMTQELAREIASSQESVADLAERLDMPYGSVYSIKVGRRWRAGAADGASVFNWGGS